MVLPIAALLTIGALVFTLFVRAKDVPPPEPVSPVRHLDERKAEIYFGLRDLQFEYRLGKLSDGDYQKTKLGLQAELAKVLAETDAILAQQPQAAKPTTPKAAAALKPVPAVPKTKPDADATTCPHCGATFARALKFCGECGKAMS
jgi:hypothetical protein